MLNSISKPKAPFSVKTVGSPLVATDDISTVRTTSLPTGTGTFSTLVLKTPVRHVDPVTFVCEQCCSSEFSIVRPSEAPQAVNLFSDSHGTISYLKWTRTK